MRVGKLEGGRIHTNTETNKQTDGWTNGRTDKQTHKTNKKEHVHPRSSSIVLHLPFRLSWSYAWSHSCGHTTDRQDTLPDTRNRDIWVSVAVIPNFILSRALFSCTNFVQRLIVVHHLRHKACHGSQMGAHPVHSTQKTIWDRNMNTTSPVLCYSGTYFFTYLGLLSFARLCAIHPNDKSLRSKFHSGFFLSISNLCTPHASRLVRPRCIHLIPLASFTK